MRTEGMPEHVPRLLRLQDARGLIDQLDLAPHGLVREWPAGAIEPTKYALTFSW